MKKKHFLIVFLLVVIGVGASLWLIPRKGEIALMNLRDKKYDEALQAYEGQVKEGDLSADTVGRTVDLYLKAGKIDEAIKLMEQFVAQHPNNVRALERLGTLYQYAQRPDDYIRNLERINQLAPSEKNKQILANLYNAGGQYEKQLEIMLSIAQADQVRSPDYYRDIANLQAAQKAYDRAIATLKAFKTQYPNEFGFAQTELLVSLLMDTGRKDEALQEAQTWAARKPPPEDIARLTNVLHYKGGPEQALTLITPYKEQAETNTDLLTELAAVYVTLGKNEEAYALLDSLYKQGKLPPILYGSYLELLVAENKLDEVQAFMQQIDPEVLSESQAVYLVELAEAHPEANLLALVNAYFNKLEYLDKRPVLAAVLALANRDKNADEAIARAKAQPELTNEQLTQLAQACGRARKTDCALEMVTALSERKGLSDADVAGIGEIYLTIGEYEKGLEFVNARRTVKSPAVLEKTWVKLAAANGENDTVSEWLAAHADLADGQLLRDLYYLASQNGNTPLAVKVAENLYQREPSAETRGMLGHIYVVNEQYAEAVPLLREARGESDQAENAYLEALTLAGGQNAEFKGELETYLTDRLKEKKLSDKRKQQLLYVLIDAGRTDLALPYIRDYALRSGGSWEALYQETLLKQGRRAEVREFWLAIGTGNYPAERKRRAAFSLLNASYKPDATGIFRQLAEKSGPDSKDTKQLLYLWGPRPPKEGIDWLAARAENSRGRDQAKWLTYLADARGADEVVRIVRAHPEVLNQPEAVKPYLQSLAWTLEKTGDSAALKSELEKQIAAENNPTTLQFYGDLARAHYLNPTARMAYAKLHQIEPQNHEVEKQLGILAYMQADYSEAKQYLTAFADADRTRPRGDDYLAYFYLGEMYNRDRRRVQAEPYYFRTIEAIEADPAPTAEKRSVWAQAHYRLGETDTALTAFDALLTKEPGNRAVRADYAGTLVEARQYARARQVLKDDAATRGTTADGVGSRALLLDGKHIRSYEVSENGSEVLIQLNRPAESVPALAKLAKNPPAGIGYATLGYDQVLIGAGDNTKLEAARTATGLEIIADNGTRSDSSLLASQMDLRMELLSSRIDLETGKTDDALDRLNKLAVRYPNDSQLMGYTANAEYYAGRWVRADQLTKAAQALAPENEDIAVLQRNIDRTYGQNVKLDHEYRSFGDNNEQITTLSGQVFVQPYLRVGVKLQNDFVDSVLIRRSDGRVGEFSEAKQRGEITLTKDLEDGTSLKGAIYGNNDTVGAGFEYGVVSGLGQTVFGIDWHRPYWEFPEAVLADTTRDRIGVSHTMRLSQTLTALGSLGYNIYNVDVKDDVQQTVSVTFNLIKELKPVDPYFAVAYGLDGEYGTSSDTVTNTFGTYRPLPGTTREVHSLSLLGRWDFNERTYAGGALGYAYDRYGGNGPLAEAYLIHMLTDAVEVGVRASEGLGVSDTDDDVTRIGAHILLRF